MPLVSFSIETCKFWRMHFFSVAHSVVYFSVFREIENQPTLRLGEWSSVRYTYTIHSFHYVNGISLFFHCVQVYATINNNALTLQYDNHISCKIQLKNRKSGVGRIGEWVSVWVCSLWASYDSDFSRRLFERQRIPMQKFCTNAFAARIIIIILLRYLYRKEILEKHSGNRARERERERKKYLNDFW